MKPDLNPEHLLKLVPKLAQLWKNPTQHWQLKLFCSALVLLSALYGIGSLPSSDSSAKPIKPEQPPTQALPPIQQKGDCANIINGNGNTIDNSRNCSPSSHSSFFGGLSGQSFYSESIASIALYNLGLSTSGQSLLLASHSLSASGTIDFSPKGNLTISQPPSSVFLPIAIGFQRTEKFAEQMGASLFANAAPVGNTIITGLKRVKHFAAEVLEPERSEPSSAAPRSCSPGVH